MPVMRGAKLFFRREVVLCILHGHTSWAYLAVQSFLFNRKEPLHAIYGLLKRTRYRGMGGESADAGIADGFTGTTRHRFTRIAGSGSTGITLRVQTSLINNPWCLRLGLGEQRTGTAPTRQTAAAAAC